ncbi:MAG: hypothetical protein EOS73_32085 [Mesorhizobium sp.]|uniref:hypothetical protein n=1 Tax=Mesorhizobium sp. M7A.F.Ca.ET.027.02.1.1 TaxID=2496655 RepID=UPI000FD48D91|nr:hypothetical protein [Mesorhizobium sp. M7A.F.Ca.ET.027.02.1.1]RVD15422.1 hypothetical protein EN749_16100 [Mesorhizobium sp. M7A.F.Ca.ET.027.02.1.1]RWC98072.1 MAG: hypothetical protein EOS73_32085 [Mesorhizobium sp.]
MADIAFLRFANAFHDRLKDIGYSLRRAEHQWPDTDRAMLSRAINAKTLSAGNYLLLCEMAGLDPYAYLERPPHRRVTLKSIAEQMVTPSATRETEGAR